LRYKFRRDRRPGLPIEPRCKFYPKYALESAVKMAKWFKLWARLRGVYVKIKHDPKKWEYTDLALTPVTDEEVETLEIFHTHSAPAFVAQEQKRAAASAERREHAAVM
jgi:hypothetical protein